MGTHQESGAAKELRENAEDIGTKYAGQWIAVNDAGKVIGNDPDSMRLYEKLDKAGHKGGDYVVAKIPEPGVRFG